MWKVLAKLGNRKDPPELSTPPFKAWPTEEVAPPDWDPKLVYNGTREECLTWIRKHSPVDT